MTKITITTEVEEVGSESKLVFKRTIIYNKTKERNSDSTQVFSYSKCIEATDKIIDFWMSRGLWSPGFSIIKHSIPTMPEADVGYNISLDDNFNTVVIFTDVEDDFSL